WTQVGYGKDGGESDRLLAGTLTTATSGAVTSTFNAGLWSASGTRADVNTLLAGVAFVPAANWDQSFTIATSINDGITFLTGNKSVTVTPVNDPPTATNLDTAQSLDEDTTSVDLADIWVADVENAAVTVTLTLSDATAGSLTTATSGAVTSTFAAGMWSASGALANVNTLLAGVAFVPAANHDQSFTIATSVGDGTTTITGTKNMTVTAINDAPTATYLNEAQTYTEDTPLPLTPIVITDVDSANVTATLAFPSAGIGTLSTATVNGVTSSFDGTTWTASGPKADVTQLLAGVTFTPTANYASNFSLLTKIEDNATASVTDSKALTASPVNDAPVVSVSSSSLEYLQGDAATVVDGTLTLSDIDSTHLSSATITISGYVAGEDKLAYGATNDVNGVLTISGTDTLANFQAALRTITYYNTNPSANLSSRSIQFTVTDGGGQNSTQATRTLNIAQAIQWGGGTGDWSIATNWTPNTVPGSGQRAVIPSGTVTHSSGTTTLSSMAINGGSLTLSGGTLTLTSASTLASGASMTLSGGTLAGSGSLTVAGALTWNNTSPISIGRVQINSGGSLTLPAATTLAAGTTLALNTGAIPTNLTINGALEYNVASTLTSTSLSGTGSLVFQNATSLRGSATVAPAVTVQSGATLTLDASSTAGNNATQTFSANFTNAGTLVLDSNQYSAILAMGSGKTLTNTGTITLAGNTNGTDTISGAILNTGTIDVTVDDLNVTNTSVTFNTANGTLNVASGLSLTIAGGTTRFGSGTTLTGAGTVNLTGTHTLDIGAGYTHATNNTTLRFDGSVTVTGSGSFTNTGTLVLRGISDYFDVPFVNAAGAALRLNANASEGNNATVTFRADITNAGTLTLESDYHTSTLILGSGKTLYNTGTINLAGDTDGIDTIDGSVTNTGTIDVTTDDLSITNTSATFNTVGGTLNVASGRTLTVAGGTTRFGAGTTLTGTGTVNLTGTHTLDIGTGYTHATNDTTLRFDGSVTVTGTGSFTNAGTLTLRGTSDYFNVPVVNNSGATLNLNANTATATNTTPLFNGDITNAGTLTLESDYFTSILTLGTGKTLTNTGTINLAGNTTGVDTIDGSVTNTGTIDVTVDDLSITNTSATFNSVGGTLHVASGRTLAISGGTTRFGAGTTLTGTGTVNLTGTHTLDIGTGYTHATNDTTLRFDGNVTVTGTGSFTNTGTLILRGTGDYFNTPVVNAAGATLNLNANTATETNTTPVFNGDITNAGTLTIESDYFTSILTLGAGKTLTNTGTINLAGNTTGTDSIDGSITNTGTIDVTVDDLSITNTSATFNSVGGTLNVASGRTLTVTNGTTRFGTGTTLTGTGTINLAGTHTLDIDTGYTHATNDTTLRFDGNVTVTGTGSFTNTGTLILRGTGDYFNVPVVNAAGATLNLNASATSETNSTPTFNGDITNAGTLTLDSNYYTSILTLGTGKTLTNTGTINMGGNTTGTDAINGTLVNSGSLLVNLDSLNINGTVTSSGIIDIASGQTLALTGSANDLTIQSTGTLRGSGAMTVANNTGSNLDGTILPGSDGTAGTLYITHSSSSLAMGATTTLKIDIGGTTVTTQYDKLAITGTVVLDGTIQINPINGFTPANGDTFTVLSYNSTSSGSIDRIDGLLVSSGIALDPLFSTTNLTLTARTVDTLGDTGNNVLAGTTAQEVMRGDAGDDTLTANGTDLLFGEAGNDVFVIADTNFKIINGGAGTDTLQAQSLNLNLTTLPSYRLADMEIIDLSGGIANTLTLKGAQVKSITDSADTLLVKGSAGDAVAMETAWSGNGSVTIDGTLYNQWLQGGATLNIQNGMTVTQSGDPIIIDLNGDGIHLVTPPADISFAMTPDGAFQPLAWVSADDGFLVMDKNENTLIDDISELFSEYFQEGAASGIEALATLDVNGDGKVDGNDDAYSRLAVWQDADLDGTSSSGEIRPLVDWGITALDLVIQPLDTPLEGGTLVASGDLQGEPGAPTRFGEVDIWVQPTPVTPSPDDAPVLEAMMEDLQALGEFVLDLTGMASTDEETVVAEEYATPTDTLLLLPTLAEPPTGMTEPDPIQPVAG
ncbi:MAG: hypothetical protein HQM03_02710, partial [Magnetococcales bacterium]|nr:hypothetical protein [Magnetococcales bacterium]